MVERKILVLSDLHVGSLWGLFPADFSYEDPRTGDMLHFERNKTQIALTQHFEKCIEKNQDVDAIIFNGDLCDGPQRKSIGKEVVSSDLMIQAEACAELLDKLPKDCNWYFTLGSEYHSLGDRPLEQQIARYFGQPYGDDLLIDECGIRIHAQHYIPTSTSAWMYRTTPIARDSMMLSLNAAEDKYGKVDIAVRSHAHYFASVQFPKTMAVITPCWQTRTPFGVKKGILSQPDIGWITLKIGDDIMIDRSGITSIGKPCKSVGSAV